jgi:hypothetical protein
MMHDFEDWERWYEPFGSDWYLQGPVYESQVSAGTYYIEVHSDNNTEAYSLAIGRIESFSLLDIIKVVLYVPLIKALYWGNYVNIAFYICIFLAIAWWIRRRRHRESAPISSP